MSYTWKGRDGERYDVATVTDSHLRFAHRLFQENHASLEKQIEDRATPEWGYKSRIHYLDLNPTIETRLDRIREGILELGDEIERRGLTALRPRTPEEQQQAKDQTLQKIREKTTQKEDKVQEELHRIEETNRMLAILRMKRIKLDQELAQLHQEIPKEKETKPERKIILVPKHED